MTIKKLFTVLFLAAIVTLGSTQARAADSATAITVTDVRFGTVGVFLNTSDGYFYGRTQTLGSCSANSVDLAKSWLAIGQAALLSGRKIHIVYTLCATGVKGITEMWLLNN